jgi:hypothetical protein
MGAFGNWANGSVADGAPKKAGRVIGAFAL